MTSGVLLFLGPDRPRKLQRIQEIERSLRVSPFDRHHLDATVIPSAALTALCRQRPAASPLRLVVVDHAEHLRADAIDALHEHAEAIAATACVILLADEALSARHALAHASGIRTEQFPGRDTPAVKPFALIEALGSRDAAAALASVADALQAGKDPVELFGLMAWQLQRWVLVKRLVEQGYRTDQIVALAGLRDWQVPRIRSEVAGRSLASLDALLERCWELEAEAKTGRIPPLLAIEELVVRVCVPDREDVTSRLPRG